MPKYPGISPYDNEKGTLGTAKKRWEKLYVKEIESDTVSGMHAEIENLATTAENSVANAVAAKNAAVDAKAAAETAAETAATAAAGIQSVVETDVDNTLSIAGVAADAKVTGDWLRDIAKPVTLNTSLPETAYADEYMKVTTDSEGRVLYGVKRDGTFTWQKGVPKHLQDKINELAAPTIDNDEYMYVMLDSEGHVLFGVKRDGSFDWQKGVPKPVKEKLEEVAQTVIQSDEFVQLTQDSEGRLISGISVSGKYSFFSKVKFSQGIDWSFEDVKDAANILGIMKAIFSPTNYIEKHVAYNLSSGLPVFSLTGDTTGISRENKIDMRYSYKGTRGTCTLKWQGSSSMAYPKKNYTVAKMSIPIDVGWGFHKKYVLKANFIDHSQSRNIVCSRLWGQVVQSRVPRNERLVSLPNKGAVDGFPVMLFINGEYQGLYTLNIPKDDWLLGMGSGESEVMISGEQNGVAPTAFKQTVTVEDVRQERYFSIEYISTGDDIEWAVNSLNRMITAAINSTGANYRETLEDYMDIESAIDYYIYSCLIGNYDGLGKNYVISSYDGIKWFFTAYDLDSTFGLGWDGSYFLSAKSANPTFASGADRNRVFRLIYRYDTAKLKERYAELRSTVLSEYNVSLMFTNFIGKTPKAVSDSDFYAWPEIPQTNIDHFSQITDWYRNRVKFMDEEIANL